MKLYFKVRNNKLFFVLLSDLVWVSGKKMNLSDSRVFGVR